ncbi:Trematode Eggshell Synthesis domain containing protein [Schistosoma mansoni]|uniref:Trematode Eggshell Synthesis domain containing protein n=1 Tax=Schistosoma mansoni TaxID=6183 RepID=G4LVS0_SCHMA|nr:Trematode Eggshell Synthesis domain containing protein [Schistosoma mansoni]|eukprot:XP_018645367.1 Trematode Eggshell Synthesis domain containing protein [Schistosoma mansoni]
MKIITLLSFIFLPTILSNHIDESSDISNRRDSFATTMNSNRSAHKNEKNDEKHRSTFGGEFDLSWLSGGSNRRYAFKEEGEANAKGNFNRHGRGEYDSLSTRSSRFKVKGSYDKYGRRTFQYSKLKRGGKRKSYSKRFSFDNFNINGNVSYKRKSMGLGSNRENAKHVKIKFSFDSDSDGKSSKGITNSRSRSRRDAGEEENNSRRNSSLSFSEF